MARDRWKVSAGTCITSDDAGGTKYVQRDVSPDEQAIIDRINWHVLACQDCREGPASAPSFEFCRAGSAMIDARDAYNAAMGAWQITP